jgi:hypothetical protein
MVLGNEFIWKSLLVAIESDARINHTGDSSNVVYDRGKWFAIEGVLVPLEKSNDPFEMDVKGMEIGSQEIGPSEEKYGRDPTLASGLA